MSTNETLIKQIVAIRRKPDMTRKEFMNHHFQLHGAISDSPEDPELKPHKYIQIHLFDGAFGGRPDALNANQPWFSRDDITELYFRDWAHLRSVFTSEHVKTQVGPDGLKFSDIEAPLPMMAREKSISLQAKLIHKDGQIPKEGERVVAMLWLSVSQETGDGVQVEESLTPKLVAALEASAASDIWGLSANIGIQPEGFDLAAYFGGSSMPTYHLAYKILLKDRASVTAVRKAQAAFYEKTKDQLNLNESSIVFGIEGLILDIGNNTRFDPERQPEMPDL